jgi:hypothetical protein
VRLNPEACAIGALEVDLCMQGGERPDSGSAHFHKTEGGWGHLSPTHGWRGSTVLFQIMYTEP